MKSKKAPAPPILPWVSDCPQEFLTRDRLWAIYQTSFAVFRELHRPTPVQEAAFWERFEHQLVLRGCLIREDDGRPTFWNPSYR